MTFWHVVVGQGDIALGVFGEALLSHVQEYARKVERQTGFATRLVSRAFEKRPNVGDQIDSVTAYATECAERWCGETRQD